MRYYLADWAGPRRGRCVKLMRRGRDKTVAYIPDEREARRLIAWLRKGGRV